ncbi:hypothetical protein V1478_003965 [Vespula squamosa]|uniref:Uncharacterized protein n=1 Tax=Vespula squamosa TaxID=30214 RepID=A0ABD2BNB3_VESSQ
MKYFIAEKEEEEGEEEEEEEEEKEKEKERGDGRGRRRLDLGLIAYTGLTMRGLLRILGTMGVSYLSLGEPSE